MSCGVNAFQDINTMTGKKPFIFAEKRKNRNLTYLDSVIN